MRHGRQSVRHSWLALLLLLGIHGDIIHALGKDDVDDEKHSWSSLSRWKPLFLRRAANSKSGLVWNETASVFRENVLLNFEEETKQLGQRVEQNFKQFSSDFSRELRTMQQEFKKGLLRDVLNQHVGWKRVRRSIRAHLGAAVGFWVTFRGQVEPVLTSRVNGGKGGAWALHFGQTIWRFLNAGCHLGHSPWLQDLVSITVAVVTWKYLLPRAPSLLSQGHVLFAITLLPLCSLVLEEWSLGKEEWNANFPKLWAIVGLIFLSLKVAQIPIPMASSSLSGALLIYDSARDEIAGNWVNMMEKVFLLGRGVLRLIHRFLLLVRRPALHLWKQWLKGLVKKLFYPEATKNLIGRTVSLVQEMWQVITYPINNVKERIANTHVIKELNKFLQRLRRAIRPVLIPLGIAIWGVAVQMGYISGIGGVWKVFRMTANPVDFVRGRIQGLFDPESRIRKIFIGAMRCLPQHLRRFRQSRGGNVVASNAGESPAPIGIAP